MLSRKGSRQAGLARTLSKRGYCSRSAASELIRAGRVSINGEIRRNPEAPVREGRDRIEVDGAALESSLKIYLVLNKPRGVVTTASDEHRRKTVYDYIDETQWVAPVGRLDKASEGLLLLTNDPEWAARILAPETHLNKTYHVHIGMVAADDLISAIMRGVSAKDGDFLRAKSARHLRGGEKNSWLEIVLDEGRNRHIRRMFSEFGIEVLRIVRVAVGPLELGDLPKGRSRHLTQVEKKALDHAMRLRSLRSQ